jgi:serine phosphatase RsbU (regulator of sigma subunit)
MALGLAPDTRYETHRLPVPPGGLLLLYSNALIDLLANSAPEAERQEIGERNILNLLSSVAEPDGHVNATTLMDRIRELRTHRRLEDDLTIVCVERPLAAAGGPG